MSRRVHLTYVIQDVRKLLVRSGWSCQALARSVMERDDEAVAEWGEEVQPRAKGSRRPVGLARPRHSLVPPSCLSISPLTWAAGKLTPSCGKRSPRLVAQALTRGATVGAPHPRPHQRRPRRHPASTLPSRPGRPPRQATRVAEHARQSLTWDEGSEMARHHELAPCFADGIFCARPGSPWQRGTNEHTDGLVAARTYPSARSFYTADELRAIEHRLNNRPRKTLSRQIWPRHSPLLWHHKLATF
ncbi:winged helix-turn-helix domain-containing protein [Streptomyces violens]|uniref:winged helix-turn-helix domain-containing protein n=1 Tax=Streptomyces violens TaxID=66377 RepID=UPI000D1371D0